MAYNLTRKQIEDIYNSAPMPDQNTQQEATYQPSFSSGLSRDEIANIYNSYTPEIPKLEEQNTPPTTPSISDELKRMEQMKSDVTAPRTQGEQQAIDTYYNSLTEAQRYLDSQKPQTTGKKNIGKVEVKADGTKKYTKTMSNNEKANYEHQLMEQAKVVGRQAKENAQPRERALSANEQRDLERAQQAIANQPKTETRKVSNNKTAEENVENLLFGKIEKTPVKQTSNESAFSKTLKEAKNKIHPDEIDESKQIDERFGVNYALANPGNQNPLNSYQALEDALLYRSRTERTPESAVFSKYNVPMDDWRELSEDIKDWNVYRGNTSDPISAIVSSNMAKKLEDKYDIDFHTLTEIANDYKYESSQMEGERSAERSRQFGLEHPYLGSLSSMGLNLGSAVLAPTQISEDFTNYVGSGQRVSPYEGAHLLSQKKNATREGVKENIDSGIGQTAYDIGIGFGDYGAATIPSLVGAPISAAAIMALQTANDASTSALERGSNPTQASIYAIASAVPDYILNKVGLENAKEKALSRITGHSVWDFVKRNASAGGYEALENLIQEGIQTGADEIINGKNSELRTSYAEKIANGLDPMDALAATGLEKAQQYLVSAGTGFLMGSSTQGFQTLLNDAYARFIMDKADRNSKVVMDRVAEFEKNKLNPLEQETPSVSPLVQQTKNVADNVAKVVANEPKVETNIPKMEEPIPQQPVSTPVSEVPIMEEPKPIVSEQQPIFEQPKPIPEQPQPEITKVQPISEQPKVEQPKVEQPQPTVEQPDITSGNTKIRKSMTNTMPKSGVLSEIDESDPEIQRIRQYEEHSNQKTYDAARKDVSQNREKWEQDYMSGKATIDTDLDFDRGMIILQELRKEIDASDNPTALIAKRNAIIHNAVEHGTIAGEFIQAMAKYANTPEEALLKAAKLDMENVDKWKSTNQRQYKTNNRIASALANMGNKPTDASEKVPLSHDQLKQRIQSDIEREMGSVSEKFGDSQLEFLTNLAEDKRIPVWQITDEIEHYLNHGEFYPITQDAVVNLEKSSRLTKILDQVVGGKELVNGKQKAPETFEQIYEKVRNTLDDEYSSFAGQFDDNDYKFISLMFQEKVPTWKIEDEIRHRLDRGEWYTLDESTPVTVKDQSSKLAKVLDSVVGGKELVKDKAVKPEESTYDLMARIRNTIENNELAGFAKDFNDDDYFYIAQMYEQKVPAWQIEDEIRHRLEHGEWYTLDESTPVIVQKNKQLSNMLDRVVNGTQLKKAEKEPETYGEFLTKIRNTFDDETIGVSNRFNDDDVYFVAKMYMDGVPKWQIEDELRHKLETGDWYEITEDENVPKPTNQKLQRALDSLVHEEVRKVPERKTIEQIREEVRNTLAKEPAALDNMTDNDIDYLSNLMEQGASTKEIAEALNTYYATGRWGISEEAQSTINRIFDSIRGLDEDSREFVEGQAEAFRVLANEVAPKASALEKFDAWRYMAMLGNPKTMLRNYVGNKMFGALVGASNTLSAAIEELVDKGYYKKTGQHIQRQKAVINPFQDKGFIQAAMEDGFGKRYRQFEGSKYEKPTKEAILQQREVFDTKALQLYEKAVDRGISDTKAVAKKYATSLVGYLKANGLNESALRFSKEYDTLKRASRTRELTPAEQARMETLQPLASFVDKARDYAVKQAEYATFHEDNAFADWLQNKSNTAPGIVKYAIEGMVPFKKTPANILKSGYEYSPFGIIDSIRKSGRFGWENSGNRKEDLADTYTKKNWLGKEKTYDRLNASDVIESWSKSFTGSVLAGIGYYLFNKGLLTSSEKEEKYQDQLEGIGNYALNLNGHTFTLDWLAPGVMPLLVGAELNKIMKSNGMSDEEWYKDPDKWIRTFNALLDPMLETSMMSGVKDTLETVASQTRYGGDESIPGGIIGAFIGNTATGYLGQAIPTVFGQVARTIDPYRRTTDTVSDSAFWGAAEKQGRKYMNKIPGLSFLNTPYIDAHGRYQYNSPFVLDKEDGVGWTAAKALGNLAYQALSPAYYSKVNTTDGDRMAREIYNATETDEETGKTTYVNRNPKVYSEWKNTKKINGRKLNPQEMFTYRKESGDADDYLRNTLANNEDFLELDPKTQDDIFQSINGIVDKIGEYSVEPDGVNISGKLKTYVDAGGGKDGYDTIVNQLIAENNKYGLDKDLYTELIEDGEDLADWEGYPELLAEYGKNSGKKTIQLWKDGYLEEALEYGVAGYDTKTSRDAFENGKFEEYAEYREQLEGNDTMKKWQAFQQEYENEDKKPSIQPIQPTQPQQSIPRVENTSSESSSLADYDLDKPGPTATYEKAQQVIPDLSMSSFAKQYKAIDTNSNYGITQDEIIAYLNDGSYSQSEGDQIWKAYGNSGWKKIPKLEGDTWKKVKS